MTSPKISLIIVNYRSITATEALVAQVAEAVDEIIVVDNASGDSLDRLRTLGPHVEVVELATNRGYGAGANAGAARASGDVLVFANPDVEMEPDAVRALAAEALAPSVGLVAPKYVYPDGHLQRSAHRREPSFLLTAYDVALPLAIKLARRWPELHPTLLSSADHERPADVVHVLGACNAVNANAFTAVGGFDERFFMYREETDLCRRLRRAGWRVRHFPNSVAVHGQGGSTPQSWKVIGHPQMMRSHYAYIAKHWGIAGMVAARGVAVLMLVGWLVAASNRRDALVLLRKHLGLDRSGAFDAAEEERAPAG